MSKYIIVLGLLLVMHMTLAQDATEGEDIAALIQGKRFEFVAESANPMRGRTIYLSPEYLVTVAGDSLSSYLPYYGRAYQATIDPSDAGIKFTSKDYEYKVKEKRKRWDITLKPNDVMRGLKFTLSISREGYATLRAILVDRQSISFSGYIRKVKKR